MAIAIDNSARITTASSPYTVTSNTNGILLVWIGESGSSTGITGITYNGVALTKEGAWNLGSPGTDWYSLWYLFAPATGSNTLVITGDSAQAVAASYTGVAQSGFPDNASSPVTNGAATSLGATLTPVAANCWGLLGGLLNRAFSSITPSPSVVRGSGTSNVQFGDSNTTISGSTTMTFTQASSSNIGVIMFSMAPVVTVTTNSGFFFVVDR